VINSDCSPDCLRQTVCGHLQLCSQSPHTFNFPAAHVSFTCSLPTFPSWFKDSTPLNWRAVRFWSFSCTLGLTCYQDKARHKSADVLHLLKSPPWVWIPYRHKSLTLAENSEPFLFWCQLPCPFSCHDLSEHPIFFPTSLPLHRLFPSLRSFLTPQLPIPTHPSRPNWISPLL
jgi:hypothetical protein